MAANANVNTDQLTMVPAGDAAIQSEDLPVAQVYEEGEGVVVKWGEDSAILEKHRTLYSVDPYSFSAVNANNKDPPIKTFGALLLCDEGILTIGSTPYRIQVQLQKQPRHDITHETNLIEPPPAKRIRGLKDTKIAVDKTTSLSIDSDKMLNPLGVKTVHYFGRAGIPELFEILVHDQSGKHFFNISLVGPPGSGKSNLVFAAAEYIASTQGKRVLWVGRRFHDQSWKVKLFCPKPKDEQTKGAGDLLEQDESTLSLEEMLKLPMAKDVQVLVVDAPTQANTQTGAVGAAAFRWAGMKTRVGGRRVIHVSSLGSFANKQTIRDEVNLREEPMRLFTRNDYIKSLSDPDLKKEVCDTLGIDDPNSVSNEDVVDQKFFYSGINARWFYNRSIDAIKKECTGIIERLDKNLTSTGSRDPRAVNSAVATVRGDRVIYVYTSSFLAQSIGSSKGSYHSDFLKLFPFVAHTLGTGTPGEVFESDFRFHLEQCHDLQDTQVAVMQDKAEDVMVCLGKSDDGDNSKLQWPAGKINSLPVPPTDTTACQRTKLNPTLVANIPQWFIPESKPQPFFDFMALFPNAAKKWHLKFIQNTIGTSHSADTSQLARVVGGLLMDGFVLEDTIVIVFIIEDREKSGKIAASLHGSNLNVGERMFQLEVIHSVYPRLGAIPK